MEIKELNINKLIELAQNGDCNAQVELADYYYDKTNKYNEALHWYKKSADNDNADGFNGIGRCYAAGRGVKPDQNEAFNYYIKAAEKGSFRAMYNLGYFYSRGIVVKKDNEKAKYYYSLSAENGFALAQYILGCEYMHYHVGAITWQITKVKDTVKAFEWFMKSAEQECAKAQMAVGKFYQTGTDPCVKNLNKAIYWYKRAADNGNDNAYNSLAKIYQYGNEEIEIDLEKSYRYYCKAAELGNVDAKVSAGLMLYWGQGITQDSNKGIEMIKEAAKYDVSANMLLVNLLNNQPKKSESEVASIDEINSTFDEYGVQYTKDKKKLLGYGTNSYIDDENFGYVDYRTLREYVIPEGVEVICNSAFADCDTLEKITLPKSLRIIGSDAFKDCVSLSNVIIPSSVEKIGSSAFSGVKSVISRTSKYKVEIGCLIEISTKTLNSFFSEYEIRGIRDNYYEIPEGIEIIGRTAFSDSNIELLHIPRTIKKIGEGAFERCKGLHIIAFENHSNLEEIDDVAFFECTRIRSITLPNNIKRIGVQAFCQCKRLTNITISDNIEELGSNVFSSTNISEFSLPLNLKELGPMILWNSPIKRLNSNSPKFKVINNVIYSEDLKTLIQYYDSAESFIVPHHVKRIEKFAFSGIDGIKELIINDNVEELGDNFLYQTVPNVISIPKKLKNKFNESINDSFIQELLIFQD